MEEMDVSELTSEQVETLCSVAEKAAREYVLSQVSLHKVLVLNITIDTEGSRQTIVDAEVEIVLSPSMKNHDVKSLADEAIRQAFEAIEAYLGKLTCKSTG